MPDDRGEQILQMILERAYGWFDCGMIATKAVPSARERILVLEQMGFAARKERLVGHGGTEYGDYFARLK